MAIEYRLSHTASEIDRKLTAVGEIENSLKNKYYTSANVDAKIEEVNTSIGEVNTTLEEINTSLEEVNTSLATKADLVDGKIPASQLPDDIGSGGGLTEVSWEDVQDKPFYDTRVGSYYSQVENPNPVSFDIAAFGYTCCKISDLVLTRDELFSGINIIINGTSHTPIESHIQFETSDFVMFQTGAAFIMPLKTGFISFEFSGMAVEMNVPEMGIYCVDDILSGAIIEIVCGGELKTIDLKFLPPNMALGYEEKGEGIIWDGNTDGLTEVATEFDADGTLMELAFYKMSDKTPSISEMVGRQQSLSSVDGESSEIVTEGSCSVFADNGSYMVGDVFIIVCLSNDTTLPLVEMMGAAEDITFPEAGIWFAKMSVGGAVMMQTTSLTSPDTLVPIDEKFIPDTIARKSDLDAAISSLDSALTSAIGSGVLS